MFKKEDFFRLVMAIRKKIENDERDLEIFFPFYEKAMIFMDFCKILPEDEFTVKRLSWISRNLGFTIFFAVYDLYEEAQILLRQILDLIYLIIYGANHILEKEKIDEGRHDQIGNIRNEVEKIIPDIIDPGIRKVYSKLSSVVHGTVPDILKSVKKIDQNWQDVGKLGHWMNDFQNTLELAVILCRLWFNNSYSSLTLQLRINFETNFKNLKLLEKSQNKKK